MIVECRLLREIRKTSTAECVAANVGKPLFPITICDLDIGGPLLQQVGRNCEKNCDFGRKWNCILLLDEADIFLNTRVAVSIIQNSLISSDYSLETLQILLFSAVYVMSLCGYFVVPSVPPSLGVLFQHPHSNNQPSRFLR